METMLNQAPIFINAFSRGGSNILWNVFLSHPDVCSPIKETLEIFRIGRAGRIRGYQAVLLTRQLHFFNQKNLKSRKQISINAQHFIDRTLYEWKLKTFTDEAMRFKRENQKYTLEEVKEARLCAKNNNGLVFLTDTLYEMYPDATFFGLVRDPVALYESHKRRRIVSSLDEFVSFYNEVAGKMLSDAEKNETYHIVRFEDLIGEPIHIIRQLYREARLDTSNLGRIRFKAKPHYQTDGTRAATGEPGHHYWLTQPEIREFLKADINELHGRRLDETERLTLLEHTKVIAQRLDYATTP